MNSNNMQLSTGDLSLVSSPPPQSSDTTTQAGSNGSNTSTSRRVTIGGMHQGGATDISRSSITTIDDMFGRRPSAGIDMNMDFLSHRRDSIDSTTAVLDAAILDLTRRRLSMAVGTTNAGVNHDKNPSNTSNSISNNGINSLPTNNSISNSNWGNSGSNSMISGSHGAVTSFAARQQQLQQQQRELEQRQKELELQRQQLMAGMQEAKNAMMQHQQHSPPTIMATGGTASGNATGNVTGNSQSGMPRQHWFVCQVCNSKAFTSHDELMKHEATCADGTLQNDMPLPANTGTDLSVSGGSSSRSSFNLGSEAAVDNSLSSGPFAMMPSSMPLAMDSDKDWLTPLHCFVRRHCVEVFTATQGDVATPSKGKRKPIQVGQVGIRCPHCHSDDRTAKERERGSVYYPTTISSIYNATMNLLQRHLHKCSAVPVDIMGRYETLKSDDARSGTSKRYWVESALCLGLVDTPNGIRFSALRPPPLPSLSRQQHSTGECSAGRRNSNDFFSTTSNAVADLSTRDGSNPENLAGPVAEVVSAPPVAAAPEGEEGIPETEQSLTQSAPLVTPEDEPYSTAFSFHLISQMQPCVFTEADRLGKRKGLPPGFPGLACRHCFGGYGSGRFFPSSIKTLSDTSKTLNVLHNHMQRCRKCPQEVKETLEKLRSSHDEERAKMKFGSQKAFFARIWDRLHNNAGSAAGTLKRKAAPMRSSYPGSSGGMMPSHSQHSDPRFGPPITAPIGTIPAPSPFMGELDALTNQMNSNPKRRRSD